MRLTRLDFHRVGLWAEQKLELGPRVTVVLGDNEAGKSTTMRAIEALLFAPTRPLAAPLGEQLFAATALARLSDGSELSWSIRDCATVPPESKERLRRLFPAETGSRFRDLFRIGHGDVRAKADFLSEGGALGRVLFAAGTGASATGLQALEDELAKRLKDAESAAGSKDGLKARLSRCKELADQLGDAPRFDEHNSKSGELAAIEEELRKLDKELESLTAERNRFDAYCRGLEQHGELVHLSEQLRALEQQGAVPSIGWAASVEKALSGLTNGRDALKEATTQLAEAEGRLKNQPAVPAIFGFAREIDQLAQAVGVTLKEHGDLKKRQEELQEARSALAGLLRGFGLRPAEETLLAEGDAFAVAKARRENLKQRLAKRSQLLAELEAARGNLKKAEGEARRAEEAARELAAVPVGELEDAVRLADKLQGAEEKLQALTEQTAEESAAATRLKAELGLGDRSLEEAASLHVPEKLALDAANKRLSEALDAEKAAKKELQKQQKKDGEARDEAARLRAAESAPATAEALEQARAERQQAWEALKASWSPRWVAGAELQLPGLGARFEQKLFEADAVADRRFGSAERVCALEAAERQVCAARDEVTGAEQTLLQCAEQRQQAERSWSALWSFAGSAPAEYLPWLIRYGQLRDHAKSLSTTADARTQAQDSCAKLRKDLCTLLARELPAAASLESASALANAVNGESERRKQARARVQALEATRKASQQAHADRQQELAAAENELAKWSESWTREAQPSVPATIGADLDSVEQWLEAQERLEQLLDSIRKSERAAKATSESLAAFEQQAFALLARVRAADSALAIPEGLGAEQAVTALNQLAKEAAKLEEQRRAEETRRRDFAKTFEGKKASLESQQRDLAALWTEARLAGEWTEDGLQSAAQRAREAHELCGKHAEKKKALAALWPMGEQKACEEIAGRSIFELQGVKTDLDERLKDVQAKQRDQQMKKGERRKERDLLEAPIDRDSGEQELAFARTRATEKIEEVVALKAAIWLLEKAKQRATESAQPLIAQASDYFAALTRGAYTRLHFDPAAKEPVLSALAAFGAGKHPGELSDGTADQIWLALRLAVAREASKQTPFPLLLDDVFVHFDDQRTSAALELLGRLSEQMQIVIFTHHDRVVDLARQAIPAQLQVQVLARTKLPPQDASPVVRHERPEELVAVLPEESEKPRAAAVDLSATTQAVLETLRAAGTPMSKTEIVERVPDLEQAWSPTIKELKARNLVVQEGEKRGARYRLA